MPELRPPLWTHDWPTPSARLGPCWRRTGGGGEPSRVLLKADEEVGLAVLLRGGTDRLGRDIPAEEIGALPRDGEQWCAYECLVLHNRRLVWKIAQGYQGHGLDIEDLIQHGTIGLMRAVRKFDATRGYKLSTYSTWWIKQAITRAIADEGTLIRVPVYMHEKVSKVAVAERKLLSEGRARTVDNVAYATGLTFAEVEERYAGSAGPPTPWTGSSATTPPSATSSSGRADCPDPLSC
ncbi:sigma-70 family RNA polymerase sigma factor [Streptomyces phaeoluteigriseus]